MKFSGICGGILHLNYYNFPDKNNNMKKSHSQYLTFLTGEKV